MAGIHAFTSITTNYLPKARVLAESIRRHGPDFHVHLLLCDDLPPGFDLAVEPFDGLITLADLQLEDPAWLFSHSVVELCTAVKGPALQYLFDVQGADKVFYFDPDIAVFGRLDELVAALDAHCALLTPHQCTPETSDEAVRDNEICSLRHGVFNLGFLGVRGSGEGRRLADWWAERLRHHCFDEPPRGLFTDQRWMDLAPCFFPDIGILRDPGFNVATWNLTHRLVSGSLRDGIRVNGEPLGFYHFSGFDSGAQERMLNKYGSDNTALLELRRWYQVECDRHGQRELGERPARWSRFDDGTPIDTRQRQLYRSRPDLQRAFPDPFATADPRTSYLQWWQVEGPSDGDGGSFRAVADTPYGRVLGEFLDYTTARVRRSPRLGRLGRAGLLGPLALARRLARLLPR